MFFVNTRPTGKGLFAEPRPRRQVSFAVSVADVDAAICLLEQFAGGNGIVSPD
jgi:hypothetical protein